METGLDDVWRPIQGDFIPVSPHPDAPDSAPGTQPAAKLSLEGKNVHEQHKGVSVSGIEYQSCVRDIHASPPPVRQAAPGRATMNEKPRSSDFGLYSEAPFPHSMHGRRTLAERRQHGPPPQLGVRNQGPGAVFGSRNAPLPGPVVDDARSHIPPTPETPHPIATIGSVDDHAWESESVYSCDGRSPSAQVSPLRLQSKNSEAEVKEEEDSDSNSIFQNYHEWKKSPGAKSAKAEVAGESECNATAVHKTGLYSPLTPYFTDKNYPAVKKGSKVLIGQNGWLERTGKTPEKKKEGRKKSVMDSLKKMARDMATTSGRRTRDADKGVSSSASVAISLDPREQSLLYCELEFYLSCAIHGYITVQLNHGRLDPDKLKRIADSWANKGRPRVVGFRYDLETQLELISLHSNNFRFYGCQEGNQAEVTGLLHTMKVNARAMRIRTFCQPDSVIAKQLVDTQAFFILLGVPEVQQVALHQVSQFFKVIVEREQGRDSRFSRIRAQSGTELASYEWERNGLRAARGLNNATVVK